MLEAINPPDDKPFYICEKCGAELSGMDYVYFNEFGEVIGCEMCVTHKFAGDYYDDDQGV